MFRGLSAGSFHGVCALNVGKILEAGDVGGRKKYKKTPTNKQKNSLKVIRRGGRGQEPLHSPFFT